MKNLTLMILVLIMFSVTACKFDMSDMFGHDHDDDDGQSESK